MGTMFGLFRHGMEKSFHLLKPLNRKLHMCQDCELQLFDLFLDFLQYTGKSFLQNIRSLLFCHNQHKVVKDPVSLLFENLKDSFLSVLG